MRRAFTLLELLVVVAVIAVLAALAYPLISTFQEKGRAVACMQHLRTLGSALNLYLGDNNLTMPKLVLGRESVTDNVPAIDNTLDRYLGDKKAFACPSDQRLAKLTGTSYHWNSALNGQALAGLNFLGMGDQPAHIPVMGDKEGFHRDRDHKVNILYADGRASKELSFVQTK
jgi:prepilin-type N-terminal cleavage/methylation domain-containing protein/prepilin-type processing-associated H-X9-DG protein